MFDTSWLKIVTFLGVWAVIWLPIAAIVSRSINWRPGHRLTPRQKLILLSSLYFLSPIVLTWKIRVENVSWVSLGLTLDPPIFGSILLGLTFSVVGLIIIYLVQLSLNLVNWHQENIQQLFSLLLPILILSFLITTVEETIFRGYVFTTLRQDYSLWWAATISSIIFASLHLVWETKETLPQIPGLWLMGMILVGARIIDRDSIGLALGLHTGWIWGAICVDSASLITYQQQNSWLTGINQQPLAGMIGISGLIATGLALWLFTNNGLELLLKIFLGL